MPNKGFLDIFIRLFYITITEILQPVDLIDIQVSGWVCVIPHPIFIQHNKFFHTYESARQTVIFPPTQRIPFCTEIRVWFGEQNK